MRGLAKQRDTRRPRSTGSPRPPGGPALSSAAGSPRSPRATQASRWPASSPPGPCSPCSCSCPSAGLRGRRRPALRSLRRPASTAAKAHPSSCREHDSEGGPRRSSPARAARRGDGEGAGSGGRQPRAVKTRPRRSQMLMDAACRRRRLPSIPAWSWCRPGPRLPLWWFCRLWSRRRRPPRTQKLDIISGRRYILDLMWSGALALYYVTFSSSVLSPSLLIPRPKPSPNPQTVKRQYVNKLEIRFSELGGRK